MKFYFKNPPKYSKLRVFGCLCFPWLAPCTTNKLQSPQPRVFIGYSNTQSAYLCFHPPSQKTYTSHHVYFVKNTFPYSTTTATSPFPNLNSHALISSSNSHNLPQPITIIHTVPTNTQFPQQSTDPIPLFQSSTDQPLPFNANQHLNPTIEVNVPNSHDQSLCIALPFIIFLLKNCNQIPPIQC